MPRYEITSPDGKRFEITAPEGASQDEVLKYAQQQFAAPKAEPTRAAPGSEPLPGFGQNMRDMGLAAAQGIIKGGLPGLIAGATGEGMRQFGHGVDRAAYEGGGAVTDALAPHVPPEVAGGAGYLANVATQAVPVVAGSLVGNAAQRIVEGPVRAVGRTVRNIVDPWTKGGVDRAVGRTAVAAAGDKTDEVIAALRQNQQIVPGSAPTAGQAAAPAGSAEFSGLQRVVEGRRPSDYRRIIEQAEEARLAAIRAIGKDKAALTAAEGVRKATSDPLYAAAREGTSPVNTGQVVEKLDKILTNNPGNRELVTELNNIKKGLEASGSDPQKVSSVLDGMKAALKDEKNTFIRGVLTTIKNDLAKAIPGYEKAQAVFAAKSAPVNTMQVGQELEKTLGSALGTAERPAAFASAVREAPRTIKRATGAPRFDTLGEVDPQLARTAENVLKDLQRSAQHEQLARAGTEKARDLVGQIAPSAPAAGMFNPKYSVFRAISNRLAGRVEGKSLDRLAEAMQNPELMADLMARATPSQRAVIVNVLTKARLTGTTLGGAAGASVGYESGQAP